MNGWVVQWTWHQGRQGCMYLGKNAVGTQGIGWHEAINRMEAAMVGPGGEVVVDGRGMEGVWKGMTGWDVVADGWGQE